MPPTELLPHLKSGATDEFEQIDKEMKKRMFIGPQPKGLVKARNRLHHFFN